jgi:hypothetical protein
MISGLSYKNKASKPLLFDFRFSQGTFRDNEIFDSALSVPGRYILEIGQILIRQTSCDWLVCSNPLIPLSSQIIASWIESQSPSCYIAATSEGFPLFYCLPRYIFEQIPQFLLLLSLQKATLDGHFLEAISRENCSIKTIQTPGFSAIPRTGSNGWINSDHRLASLIYQCDSALTLIQNNSSWQKIPFVTYYPMHAGDVFFMAYASKITSHLLYQKHLVCDAYRDIPPSCDSKLDLIPLLKPPISRDGRISEATYFSEAMKILSPEITKNHFFVFSRILRLYYKTPFHLIDHAAFALGKEQRNYEELFHHSASIKNNLCSIPPEPLKILCHFDGGWHLKKYPKESIELLFTCLKKLNIEISVIGRAELASEGIKTVQSHSVSDLRKLIESHHVFIGVDSFPHHFSRHVMNWPTLGLFGNTKPTNSDSFYHEGYRSNVGTLSCNRCGAYDICPVFGGDECINYGAPEDVLAIILALAKTHYGFEV